MGYDPLLYFKKIETLNLIGNAITDWKLFSTNGIHTIEFLKQYPSII